MNRNRTRVARTRTHAESCERSWLLGLSVAVGMLVTLKSMACVCVARFVVSFSARATLLRSNDILLISYVCITSLLRALGVVCADVADARNATLLAGGARHKAHSLLLIIAGACATTAAVNCIPLQASVYTPDPTLATMPGFVSVPTRYIIHWEAKAPKALGWSNALRCASCGARKITGGHEMRMRNGPRAHVYFFQAGFYCASFFWLKKWPIFAESPPHSQNLSQNNGIGEERRCYGWGMGHREVSMSYFPKTSARMIQV